MSERNELIARYADAAPSERELLIARASLEADQDLLLEVRTEESVLQALAADREALTRSFDAATADVSVLDELLGASAAKPDNKVIPFVLGGVVAIVALLAYFILTAPNTSSPSEAPSTQPFVQTPQIPVRQADTAAVAPTTDPVPVRKAPGKGGTSQPKKPVQQQLDLDKDLAPPKVFDDKKGEMPLKKH
jgi:hypothetical protein